MVYFPAVSFALDKIVTVHSNIKLSRRLLLALHWTYLVQLISEPGQRLGPLIVYAKKVNGQE